MFYDLLKQVRPTKYLKVISLLSEAGVDVSDWANYDGTIPGRNPKYCYEWAFVEPGKLVALNLWYEAMEVASGEIFQHLVLKGLPSEQKTSAKSTTWRRRRKRMEESVQIALSAALPIRVIVCDGKRRDSAALDPSSSKVERRMLDPEPWAITEFDLATGKYTLVRGLSPVSAVDVGMARAEGFEGQLTYRYSLHRKRESKLREAKIEESLSKNGSLICEVPGCGFDFAKTYGATGEGYAHVHHLVPLSDAPSTGHSTTLDDLAIVCANCHAMIHKGGKCRPLDGLIEN